MNIGILIIAIVGGATGLLSTAYLAIKHFPSKKDPEAFARVPCRIHVFCFTPAPGPNFHPPRSQLL